MSAILVSDNHDDESKFDEEIDKLIDEVSRLLQNRIKAINKKKEYFGSKEWVEEQLSQLVVKP